MNPTTEHKVLSPVSSLPMELLLQVFRHIALCDFSSRRSLSNDGDSGDDGDEDATVGEHNSNRQFSKIQLWRTLVHVCRGWRSVALACPTLWNCPSFECRMLAMEMLKRSKGVPLDIEIDVPDYKTPASHLEGAVRAALQHVSRFRSIRLSGQSGQVKVILDELMGPTPLLETVEIRMFEPPEHLISSACFILPPEMFAKHTVRLRFLGLHFCHVATWDSPCFATLTTLLINRPPLPIRTSLESLVRMLGSTPHLERITLWDALPSREEHFAGVASLAHLSVLKLDDNAVDVSSSLLEHIHLPSRCNVDIQCAGGPSWVDHCRLIRWLRSHAQESTALSTKSYVKLELGEHSFSVRIGALDEGRDSIRITLYNIPQHYAGTS